MLLYRVPEFNIPEVKPAIEVVHGERFQKMSPRKIHALLQLRLGVVFLAWARDRGEVGTEWRFYLMPRGTKPSSLVPDVAYVSHGRLAAIPVDEREKTPLAPDIAVEVLSPDDRLPLLETKIALYLGNGGSLVVVVDPKRQTVRMVDATADRVFAATEFARSDAYPDLDIDIAALFKGIA
jgi:Uma2 family endonuclease